MEGGAPRRKRKKGPPQKGAPAPKKYVRGENPYPFMGKPHGPLVAPKNAAQTDASLFSLYIQQEQKQKEWDLRMKEMEAKKQSTTFSQDMALKKDTRDTIAQKMDMYVKQAKLNKDAMKMRTSKENIDMWETGINWFANALGIAGSIAGKPVGRVLTPERSRMLARAGALYGEQAVGWIADAFTGQPSPLDDMEQFLMADQETTKKKAKEEKNTPAGKSHSWWDYYTALYSDLDEPSVEETAEFNRKQAEEARKQAEEKRKQDEAAEAQKAKEARELEARRAAEEAEKAKVARELEERRAAAARETVPKYRSTWPPPYAEKRARIDPKTGLPSEPFTDPGPKPTNLQVPLTPELWYQVNRGGPGAEERIKWERVKEEGDRLANQAIADYERARKWKPGPPVEDPRKRVARDMADDILWDLRTLKQPTPPVAGGQNSTVPWVPWVPNGVYEGTGPMHWWEDPEERGFTESDTRRERRRMDEYYYGQFDPYPSASNAMLPRYPTDSKYGQRYSRAMHQDRLNRLDPEYWKLVTRKDPASQHEVEQYLAGKADLHYHTPKNIGNPPDLVSAFHEQKHNPLVLLPDYPEGHKLDGYPEGHELDGEGAKRKAPDPPQPQPSKEQIIQSLLHSHNFLAQAVNTHFNAQTLPQELVPRMGPPLVQSQPPPQPTYADQKDTKLGDPAKQAQLIPQTNFPPIGPSQFTNQTPDQSKGGLLPTPALDDAATLAADSKKDATIRDPNGKPIAPPPAATGSTATEEPPAPPPKGKKEKEEKGKGDGEGEGDKKYEMSESRLNQMMLAYKSKGFAGVIAADEIDKILPFARNAKPKLGFIMNTDPRDKPGEHWVAVEIDWDRRPSVHYYDPLGDGPTKQTINGLKRIVAAHAEFKGAEPLKLKINRVPNQRDDTSTCGLHSARFLMDMFRGRSFAAATEFNTAEGEAKARALVGGGELPKFKYLI